MWCTLYTDELLSGLFYVVLWTTTTLNFKIAAFSNQLLLLL